MTSQEKIEKLRLEDRSELFEELVDCFETDEFLDKLRRNDLQDTISEIADSNVSVYTYDQMKWLADNCGRADQEEAIDSGSRSAQEIAAFCWYRANEEELNESVNSAKELLEEIESEEGEDEE